MHSTYLDPTGSQIGKKESIADTARVLSGIYDGIEYRGYGQSIVEALAEYASVPVDVYKRQGNAVKTRGGKASRYPFPKGESDHAGTASH